MSLVLLGEAGVPGTAAARTAERLRHVLSSERDAGHHPVVLWLGDSAPEVCDDNTWTQPGAADLAAALNQHLEAGGTAFAIPGEAERRCPDRADAPAPWTGGGPAYVVRVSKVGDARVASSCSAEVCTIEPSSELDLVDLVMIDGHDDAAVPGLLAALTDPAPPRILVMHVPVESAGFHGLGGGRADAAFRYLQPAVQQALRDGQFAGVISAHDRNLQVVPDLGEALMRSDKVALPAPVFQVIAGAASRPDAARPARRIDRRRGITATPALSSDHLGFAVARVSTDTVDVELHAHRRRDWETGTVSLPLAPSPHPPARHYGSQTPCKDCPVIPVNVQP